MSDYQTVMKLKEYAHTQGCTLSDLGKRSGMVRRAKAKARIPKYKRMASSHSDEQIQAMPWNR